MKDRLSVLLVTPAYRRFELTELCLRERAKTIEKCKALGLDVQCAVIANDENLEIARELGFVAIESHNVLGMRFNNGHEYAVKNGFDWSWAIGSDQVYEAELLAQLHKVPADTLVATSWYTFVHSSGEKSLQFKHKKWAGKMYPTSALEKCPRPCKEHLMSGCDTSTHVQLDRANGGNMPVEFINHGPFEYVNFSSGNTQVTDWDKVRRMARYHRIRTPKGTMDYTRETPVPWAGLAQHYSPDFVKKIMDYYESGRSRCA